MSVERRRSGPGLEFDTRAEGEAVQRLRRAVRAFSSLHGSGRSGRYDACVEKIHAMCAAVLRAELAGTERAELLEVLDPARRIIARSPFIRRLQTWPRGYPGDFETIEYLMAGINRANEDDVSFECERYALNCAVSQQHRNKIAAQADEVLETVQRADGSRILSLACSSGLDLELAARRLSGSGLSASFVLNDSDEEAVARARGRLEASAGSAALRAESVVGNPLRAVARQRRNSFDLVMVGGILDYLTTSQASFLVRHALRVLKPGGRLMVTNVARGNPYRIWVEYFVDWLLVERSRAELLDLLCVESADDDVEIEAESSGITLIARARKAA